MKNKMPIVVILLISTIVYYSCKGFGYAPHGHSGCYRRITDSIYKTNNLCKDSILKILASKDLIIKSGRLQSYDPPWDSLRYIISNIPCDTDKIEAYIEFNDKDSKNATIKILYFESTPTEDDSLYVRKTEAFYKCFEQILKENNITAFSSKSETLQSVHSARLGIAVTCAGNKFINLNHVYLHS